MAKVNQCAIAILLEDKKILLAKRSGRRRIYPGYWDLVGGHCKPDERPRRALARELYEELDICVTESQLLEILDEPRYDVYGKHKYHVYWVIKWTGDVRNAQLEEHSKLRWFTVEQTRLLKLAHPRYPALFCRVISDSDD